jgi:hypothetical protein
VLTLGKEYHYGDVVVLVGGMVVSVTDFDGMYYNAVDMFDNELTGFYPNEVVRVLDRAPVDKPCFTTS